MSDYICGVDLGLSGGIVVLHDSKIVYKEVMPITTTGVDYRRVASIFKSFQNKGSVHIVIERFGGFFGYGKKAVVSLSQQQGGIHAIIDLLKIPHTAVMPKVWQKIIFADTKVEKKSKTVKNEDGEKVKKESKDTKKMALVTVNRLYPSDTWLKNSRCSKPHDGLIDACLLAVYGIRKGL